MNTPTLLFGYFGPETVLPVTSVVATIAGLAMMFGRHTLRMIIRCGRLILTGRTRSTVPEDRSYRGPHISRTGQSDHQPDCVVVGAAASYDRSAG
jgi:hypothetical protein